MLIPEDIVSEEIILSALLNSPDLLCELMPELQANYFVDANRKTVFNAIQSLRADKIAISTDKVALEMKKSGLSMQEAVSLLFQTSNSNGQNCDTSYYLASLKERHLAREILSLSQNMSEKIRRGDNAYNLQAEIMDKLGDKLPGEEFGKFYSGAQIQQDYEKGQSIYETLLKRMQAHKLGKDCFDGIRSGYKNLDNLIGGFACGTNTIIGARSSSGKTTFLCNLILQIAKKYPDKRIGFFSLEMPKGRIIEKLLATQAGIHPKKLMNGTLSQEEYESIVRAGKEIPLDNLLLYDESSTTINKLCASTKMKKKKDGLDIVFVDYLSRIQSDRKYSTKHLEIDYISKSLQDLSLDMYIPIVSLAQLNRQPATRQDKTPLLTDLRESGSIEEDADTVILLHRPAHYDSNCKDVTQLIVAKNRLLGDLGKITLDFENGRLSEQKHTQIISQNEVRNEIVQKSAYRASYLDD